MCVEHHAQPTITRQMMIDVSSVLQARYGSSKNFFLNEKIFPEGGWLSCSSAQGFSAPGASCSRVPLSMHENQSIGLSLSLNSHSQCVVGTGHAESCRSATRCTTRGTDAGAVNSRLEPSSSGGRRAKSANIAHGRFSRTQQRHQCQQQQQQQQQQTQRLRL